MGIVYRHRRLDTNEIFYIGIGKTEKRAYKKAQRNKWWTNIINKTDYQVEIIATDLSWEDACELEIFLIQEYGRKDLKLGNLVNLTDGGEGKKNDVCSKETRELMSKVRKGISNHTKEWKNELSNQCKLEDNPLNKSNKEKSKECSIGGIKYESLREASRLLGFHRDKIKRLIRDEKNNT